MAEETLLWHDYETFGSNPRIDRPSQFAGIRTNKDLEIIDEGINIYCKPANDFLPSPIACQVTGVTPQTALAKGMREVEFMERIYQEMTQQGTCNVGYNSVRFDDEVSRFSFFRNFFNPYKREWDNGCSRWDIINMIRMVYITKPETLNWPINPETNNVSFRLEELSAANGIVHENAHDALSDVIATIELAKIVKQKEPKLYDYFYELRTKNGVNKQLMGDKLDIILHTDSIYSGDNNFVGVMHPIEVPNVVYGKVKPTQEYILVNLQTENMDEILALSPDEIKERIFTKNDELEEKRLERIRFSKIKTNQCPAIVNYKVIQRNAERLAELNIDDDLIQSNLEKVKNNSDFQRTLMTVFEQTPMEPSEDIDMSLYDGFIDNKDQTILENIRKNINFDLSDVQFKDPKFNKLVYRFKARNYPEYMSEQELVMWDKFRYQRINNGPTVNLESFKEDLRTLIEEHGNRRLAKDLIDYAMEIGNDETRQSMNDFVEEMTAKKKSTPKP